ncbi:MAG: mandelate racemase/muconate lactonizing enzyme family protein [Dehalococcoidia bacterium]|nr:mandelate racemase/muconate lactonizing enzyme family protein [Dehalococcoidia bacterium]
MIKITSLEFRRFSAKHHNASRNWLIPIIKTDDPNIFGIGDASSLGDDERIIDEIKYLFDKYLIDNDALESEKLWLSMYNNSMQRGGRISSTAISGIDIALWDIKGKFLQKPIYTLLGGSLREKIMVYANGWYTNPGTPDQNYKEAKKVVSMGYKALKFDPFGQKNFYRLSKEEFDLSEKRISKVRDAVGEFVEILIEGHAKFNIMNAVKISNMIQKYNPLFFEEPVSEERIDELVELRKHTNISIATGERLYTKFPFASIVEMNAADVLQPDIANAGGITELKKISIIAEAKHITIAPHNTCSPVGAVAEMHLSKSIPNFEIMEYHAEFYSPHYFKVFKGFPRQKNGFIRLSDKPGLGLELNEKEIKKHPPFKSTDAKGGAIKTI